MSTKSLKQSLFPEFLLANSGQLMLVSANEAPKAVRPLRLCSLTDPEHWIQVVDAGGVEVLIVEDPSALPEDSRRVLQAALQAHEFVPQIQRIVTTSGNSVPYPWEVETNRGPHTLVVKDEKDVRALSKERFLVVDAHGICYQIAKVATWMLSASA